MPHIKKRHTMQLDHIFTFIDPDRTAIADLEAKGLSVSYRRAHVGQGTANACFVFDNAFLELLWLTDVQDARSPPIARTRLWERSQWQVQGTCPYGLAWRGDHSGIETWPFAPPYLPEGINIPVACESDDPRLPMMFTFPGSTAPRDWPTDRRNFPAHSGGWNQLDSIEIKLPTTAPQSATLDQLAAQMDPKVRVTRSTGYSLTVTISNPDGAHLALTL
jgi:Glyoxalase-like domain